MRTHFVGTHHCGHRIRESRLVGKAAVSGSPDCFDRVRLRGMSFATADLFDAYGDELQVLELGLMDFGGRSRFSGAIATVKAYEDNSQVRETLATPGQGRVLVVDGAGSRRFALLGDRLAELALEQSWSGVVVYGCVRDAAALGQMALGVRALGTSPRKTAKLGSGLTDVRVVFGGVRFEPGAWLYADEDGVVVAPRQLPIGQEKA